MTENDLEGFLDSAPKKPVKKKYHTHPDERGLAVRCYHNCRVAFLSFGFWVGLTIGFPIEHLLWEKVPIFSNITAWLGLG